MERAATGAAGFGPLPLETFAMAAAEPARLVAPGLRRDVALRLAGISLSFGGVRALSELELTVAPGEIRAVIGPNGAGKSSLINVISGLYRPNSGTVTICGQVFERTPAQRLAGLGVARTFQNLAIFGGLTVRDNVAAGLAFRRRASALEQIVGLPRARREAAEIAAQVDEVLSFMRLASHADRPAGTLPYGLQKRVELARALVARPRLLLLDEPMAGMTAAEKAEMAGYVRAARDRLGMSVILIEHDLGVVMGLSDRIAVLDYGRKIADGAPAEVRADPAVIAAYIGAAPQERAA